MTDKSVHEKRLLSEEEPRLFYIKYDRKNKIIHMYFKFKDRYNKVHNSEILRLTNIKDTKILEYIKAGDRLDDIIFKFKKANIKYYKYKYVDYNGA